jgi:hypothetical protein
MEFVTIQTSDKWGNAATDINDNFFRAGIEIDKLKDSTTRDKGYFSTLALLTAAWPDPEKGDVAWVGNPYPGTVYECQVAGTWVDTGVAPDTPAVDINNWTQGDW